MSEPKQTIHIRIKDLRRERALTQEELAEALGLSRQSINAMEAGRCLPSLPVALQIASYFSVELGTIFALEEQIAQIAREQQAMGLLPQKSVITALVPWSPLQNMQGILESFTDDPKTSPPVNITLNEINVVLEVSLPGYQKEDISLEVGDNFLLLSAETPTEDLGDRHYYRQEFLLAGFERTIALPCQVVSDQAEAEMKYGILTIRLHKKREDRPKTAKISITSFE